MGESCDLFLSLLIHNRNYPKAGYIWLLLAHSKSIEVLLIMRFVMKCMDCRVGIYQNILIARLSVFEIPFIVVLMVNRSFEVHKLIYFRNAKMVPKIMTRRRLTGILSIYYQFI